MRGFFLWIIDKILPHLHLGFPGQEAEGIKTSWHRSVLLILAITLHNIPEGLAVGVAFGALASDLPSATLGGQLHWQWVSAFKILRKELPLPYRCVEKDLHT